jgi:Flp pilus assembly protein TadG
MAKAKTGSFYLTETIQLPAASASGSRVQGTIDLSSYISVPQSLAIAIDEVDFIYQVGSDYGNDAASMLGSNGAISAQVTDLNPGTQFVRADSQTLVASGAMNIDVTNNVVTHSADMYPDQFGPAGLSDMFLVVNDTLYLNGGNDNAPVGGGTVWVTARVRCRVVTLGKSDWMAIAIQSSAND